MKWFLLVWLATGEVWQGPYTEAECIAAQAMTNDGDATCISQEEMTDNSFQWFLDYGDRGNEDFVGQF
jgi:hypothetical protein